MPAANDSLKDPIDRTALFVSYLSGNSTQEEEHLVRQSLSQNQGYADEVEYLGSVRQQVYAMAESESSPGDTGWTRIRRYINSSRGHDYGWSLWAKAAAIAAVLVIVIEVGVRLDPEIHQDFVTLGRPAADKLVLQLRFQPAATQLEIENLLHKIGAEVISGPSAAGLYRIQLMDNETDPAMIADTLQFLKSRDDLIEFAAEEP